MERKSTANDAHFSPPGYVLTLCTCNHMPSQVRLYLCISLYLIVQLYSNNKGILFYMTRFDYLISASM